jgi:hypothetical protein
MRTPVGESNSGYVAEQRSIVFFGENTNKCGIPITLENYEKQNSIYLPLCGFYSLIYSGIFGRFRSKASQYFNPNI